MSDTNDDFSGMFGGDDDTTEVAETAKEVIKEEEAKKEETPKPAPATKKAKSKKAAEESVNPLQEANDALREINNKLNQEVIDLNKLVKELEEEKNKYYNEVTVANEKIRELHQEAAELANKNTNVFGESILDEKTIRDNIIFKDPEYNLSLDELFEMVKKKAKSELVTVLMDKAKANLAGMKEPNSFIDKVISATQEEVVGKVIAAQKSVKS